MQIALNEFKSKISEYLNNFTNPIFITKHGKVVAKVLPSNDQEAWDEIKNNMKGSVLKFDDPTKPVGESDWEILP